MKGRHAPERATHGFPLPAAHGFALTFAHRVPFPLWEGVRWRGRAGGTYARGPSPLQRRGLAFLPRLAALALLLSPLTAHAQALDLSHGGPIAITASNGIEWRQAENEVIASGDAKAIRGDTTVTANRLIAWYRKKNAPADKSAQTAKATPAGLTATAVDTGGNEIYRVQADGNVHIYTQTDQAWGDRATYDLDQAVMVMTGRNLKLATPNEVLTARDDLEYWTLKHMAVARGDAVVLTRDGHRLAADTLVAYTAPATPGRQTAAGPGGGDMLGASGKLQKVEAYGNVSVRTATDTVTGDRGVYVPDTGIAVLAGNVRITRGQNQLNGAEAEVNVKTGIARLLSGSAGRVHGLVVPNDATNRGLTGPANGSATGAATGPARAAPAKGGGR